ncbi:MAG: YecA family protein [Rubrivivax sp.]|nr:MAG: YecA family protein [Rubrivivax sp.]
MNYPHYNPASDIRPLSDEELNDLDELLSILPADEAMNIEGLDGYLAGLLLTPGAALADVPGEAWLPVIWGGDREGDDNAPFVSGKQRKKVVMLVLRHLRSIAAAWTERPRSWEPIFSVAEGEGEGEDGDEDEVTEYTDAEDWAVGFLIAVDRAADAWAPLFDAPETAALLAPIAALGGADGALAEGSPQARDEASRAIPEAVLALWALRQNAGDKS